MKSRMMRGAAVAFIAASACTALAQAPASQDQERPVLWVEQDRIDLGKVKAGDEGVATFVLHNDSDKEIKIIRAKPS